MDYFSLIKINMMNFKKPFYNKFQIINVYFNYLNYFFIYYFFK